MHNLSDRDIERISKFFRATVSVHYGKRLGIIESYNYKSLFEEDWELVEKAVERLSKCEPTTFPPKPLRLKDMVFAIKHERSVAKKKKEKPPEKPCPKCGNKGYGYVVIGSDPNGTFGIATKNTQFRDYTIRRHPCDCKAGAKWFRTLERFAKAYRCTASDWNNWYRGYWKRIIEQGWHYMVYEKSEANKRLEKQIEA